MKTVKVVDSTFSHNPAIGYAGEHTGESPLYYHWDTSPGFAETKVFTDIRLKEAIDDSSPHKIALLLECPAVNAEMYDWIDRHASIFDAILTHQEYLVERGEPFLFYPFGGSWIKRWGLFPKTQMVSTLISEKMLTDGHRLRHELLKIPGIDCYGRGAGHYVESKAGAIRDYRFSVVIENQACNWWFTEKLIDCLSQGTIPIYWGCPDIGRFFDTRGIIQWSEIEELEEILANLTVEDYGQRIPWVVANLREAQKYKCPEDWIYKHYKDLW